FSICAIRSPFFSPLPKSTSMACRRPATFTLNGACSWAASEPVTVTARSIGLDSTRAVFTVRALAVAAAGFGASDFAQDISTVDKEAHASVEIKRQRFIGLISEIARE